MIKYVIKRNGSKEEFDPVKLNYWGKWASEKLNDRLDWSSVLLEAVQLSKEIISSKDLQQLLIDVCNSKHDWPHSLMAGKLYSSMMHKDLFGYTIPTVKALFKKLYKLGLMKKMDYSYEDYEEIEKIIDHDRDYTLALFQLEYVRSKYSIQDRTKKIYYESPQFTYMRMAMALSEDEKTDRMIHVKNYYNYFSNLKLNAPTPNYVNLGTSHNGYASCCLYAADDDKNSLAAGDHIAYMMTCMSAGIGGIINTRSIGDPVRNGVISHSGKLPYYKSLGGAVNANKQGGRGGACTTHYSAFDPEAIVISKLQNPKSTESKKNRDIHFSLLSNRFFAKAVAKNQDIFTFTSFNAPDLWDKFFSDDKDGFEELYVKYEDDPTFVKNYVNAREFMVNALQQSYEVATHYMTFIDEINRHTPFKESIYSSNLCQEICIPTSSYYNITDLYNKKDNGYVEVENFDGSKTKYSYSDKVNNTFAGNLKEGVDVAKIIESRPTPEIGLCSLAAIIVSNIESDEEYESVSYYALKMINKCIHLSEHVLTNAGYTSKQRMNAGVGMVGLAYHLAKKGLKYDTKEGLEEIHRIAEKHSYFLIKSSLKISKETKVAPWMHKTKWPDGWLPIDTYKDYVDQIVNIPYQYDWETLRQEIIDNGGIANSSLVAHMPTESSSKACGMPNGVYPIREFYIKKSDQSSVIDWVAIDGDLYDYQTAWEIPTKKLIEAYAVIQKFCDQSISADLYTDRTKDINISANQMLEEYFHMIRCGMKTRYYQNSKISNVQSQEKETCTSGACDA